MGGDDVLRRSDEGQLSRPSDRSGTSTGRENPPFAASNLGQVLDVDHYHVQIDQQVGELGDDAFR